MISIILPTYNSIRFLDERLKSIINQTLSGWECIVIDGYSSDGSWEKIQDMASADKRFHLYQYLPQGPYDAWNKGIHLAKGKYIYIATSDDTMSTDCLKKLAEGLDQHEDCDMAHCCLTIIDEEGKDLKSHGWDWARFPPGQYFGTWYNKRHKRIAPHDAILYGSLHTVYHSVTQLLIRRSLFEKTGLFRTDVGSSADFEWGMRAAFLTNTLHIPEYLATWRVHTQQGTNIDFWNSSQHRKQMIEMVKAAYKSNQYKQINLSDLLNIYRQEYWDFLVKERKYLVFIYSFATALPKNPSLIKKIYYLIRYYKINPERSINYINKMKLKYNLSKGLIEI